MISCETLPLCPDTTVDADVPTTLTEPIEVGPFDQGIVFVNVISKSGSPVGNVDVAISPTGYDDWDQWVTLDSIDGINSEEMYACQLSNFGNWIRLQLDLRDPDSSDSLTYVAWFVGKG